MKVYNICPYCGGRKAVMSIGCRKCFWWWQKQKSFVNQVTSRMFPLEVSEYV